jgi:hypothetical protein
VRTTWADRNQQKTCLFLDKRQLFQIPLQEGHLFLLRLAVAITDNIVVLFLDFIQLNFKFNNLKRRSAPLQRHNFYLPYLLTAVLKVSHKRLLDTVKLCKLDIDGLSSALQILSTLCKVLATLNTCRGDGKRSLLEN